MTEPAVDKAALRRSRQTTFNLVIALIASFGIVLFLMLVVVRPEAAPQTKAVDWHAAAAAAQADNPERLIIDPKVGDDAWANRAEMSSGDQPVWSIGWVQKDPNGNFSLFTALDQYPGQHDYSDLVGDSAPATFTDESGLVWTQYDRTTTDDPGNYAWVWVLEAAGDTVIVSTSDVSTDPRAALDVVNAIGAFLDQNGAN
ncbi:uncharacterized protein DUF4245 [Microbacteriaceae bacterium MWH-Ta3]|nr:uncharacterized protein DUF4245 [Microbacteriaceae bacterium MWH-Ta3]